MSNYLQEYLDLENKIATLNLAYKTMYYDSSTIAPINGENYRNRKLAELAGEIFTLNTSEKRYQLLQILSQQELSLPYSRQIRYQLEDLTKLKVIPTERYIAFNQLLNDGEKIWERAKKANDYRLFEPTLAELIQFSQEIYGYRLDTRDIYDQMLDDYEPNTNREFYDDFFNRLKPVIIELLAKQAKKDFPFANQAFPVNKQVAFTKYLAAYLCFDADSLYMGVSAHPYSSSFSINDARITNRYNPDDFSSSIFSLIHELGHATYNNQVDPIYEGCYIADCMSMGMHESQSRFYENYLGRQTAFWDCNYFNLQSLFPKQLKEVSQQQFVEYINYASASPIRVEADELSYCLHIIIRYELEKGLFSGLYETKDLDKVWKQKYHDYLGLLIKDDQEGILQDVHWSSASFGYFPTYALGSAYAAQFYHQLTKELPIETLLSLGKMDQINVWLKEKIHHDGGCLRAEEVLKRVTGEGFNPQYYIDYLSNKYQGN